jgi:glucose-1-phosphate cytidylyltransferase
MKHYETHGITDFIVCCGYKGESLKEYFSNYRRYRADITVDLGTGDLAILNDSVEPWKVTLIDTGASTMTGGRLKRVRQYIEEDTFCMTYGDGVSNIDITRCISSHKQKDCFATVTAVRPPGRFGALEFDSESLVRGFKEKPSGDGDWINGGFFVLEKSVFDYIEGDQTVWEQSPLKTLARDGKLNAHFHDGFWQPMDTLRDKMQLEALWSRGEAEWKTWN